MCRVPYAYSPDAYSHKVQDDQAKIKFFVKLFEGFDKKKNYNCVGDSDSQVSPDKPNNPWSHPVFQQELQSRKSAFPKAGL